MKKILISTIAAIAVFSSCQKQDTVIATGDLVVNAVVNEDNAQKSGKDVNRGNIPAYVKGIFVTTENASGNTETQFDLVENGGEEAFIISDLPIGPTQVNATTQAVTNGINEMVGRSGESNPSNATRNEIWGWVTAAAQDKFGIQIAEEFGNVLPLYAEYQGSTNALITQDNISSIKVNMTTKHGRVMTAFFAENSLDLEHYNITITAKTSDNKVSTETIGAFQGENLRKSFSAHIWNNATSVDGENVEFTLEWRAEDDNTILSTQKFTVKVEGGVDKFTKVLISRESFTQSSAGLTFDFTPIVTDEDVVIIGESGSEVISMSSIIDRDWNTNNPTPQGFIATDGSYLFKWTRDGNKGYSNLGAAVYESTYWDFDLHQVAYKDVVGKDLNDANIGRWDLLVYNQYTNADLANAWKAKYFANGVFKADEIRSNINVEAYDAYGVVIGLYRAMQAGYVSKHEFDESVAVVKSVISNSTMDEWDNAYYKLVYMETGVKLANYSQNIDATGFSSQSLGFAIRAYYDVVNNKAKMNLYSTDLQVKAVRLANSEGYSLSSMDIIQGYFHIQNELRKH